MFLRSFITDCFNIRKSTAYKENERKEIIKLCFEMMEFNGRNSRKFIHAFKTIRSKRKKQNPKQTNDC